MSVGTPRRLPQLELECLQLLWKRPSASVAEIRAGLPRPLAYTTVMTVLDRMAAKGVVTRRKDGRAFHYSAILKQETARAEAVRLLLANHFGQDARALIRYLSEIPQSEADAVASTAAERPTRAPIAPREAFLRPRIDDTLL